MKNNRMIGWGVGAPMTTTNLGYSDVVLRTIALYEVMRRLGFTPNELFFEVTGNGRLMDQARSLSPFLFVRSQGLQFAINVDEQKGLDEAESKVLRAEMTRAAAAHNAGAYPFDDADRLNALIHTTLMDMGGAMPLMHALTNKGFSIPMIAFEFLAPGTSRGERRWS